MNDIQIFQYQGKPVRTVQKDGEPWWVLKDVCEVLELSTPARVSERLDGDEVSQTHIIDSIGRQQETTIINESGLYNVILRSDKPQAKPFRRWVTGEVLPAIRKYGFYSAGDAAACKIIPKTWRGEPVITVKEFQKLSGTDLSTRTINTRLYEARRIRKGHDYFMLEGAALHEFKVENPQYPPQVKHLILISKSGIEKLMRKLGLSSEIPADILDKSPAEMPSQQLQLSDVPDALNSLDDLGAIRRKLIAIDELLDTVQLVLTKSCAQ